MRRQYRGAPTAYGSRAERVEAADLSTNNGRSTCGLISPFPIVDRVPDTWGLLTRCGRYRLRNLSCSGPLAVRALAKTRSWRSLIAQCESTILMAYRCTVYGYRLTIIAVLQLTFRRQQNDDWHAVLD